VGPGVRSKPITAFSATPQTHPFVSLFCHLSILLVQGLITMLLLGYDSWLIPMVWY
jgi:hypothetical protein